MVSGSSLANLPWGSIWQGTAGAIATDRQTAVSAETARLAAPPGRIISLEGPTGLGMTRIGLGLLSQLAAHLPVAVVDVRGWICPLAAWELGIPPERLVTVRCDDPIQWPKALAALLEGIGGVYAEVPPGVPEQALRRLSALARSREAAVVLRPLRGKLPAGVSFLRLQPTGVVWEGPEAGHGRLKGRNITLEASGKGAAGMQRVIEMEDDGTNLVHLVSGMASAPPRRAAG